ncbi:hypothetical protein [Tautonia sociabilis]|uniref:Uncharacterized protein n=1 Tax=Tautonia sociabilis TaxID=2080755 RepID=A0A432MEA9_9BACT|nr:hypothetical protein [Tautonia sociabilis]RUL83572.1 hypothetical protein TsocGM_21955 [Tautonia sociabilis]
MSRPIVRVRTLLIGVAVVGVLLGLEANRRRCPEYWDPATAESAAREAGRHARLRRSYERRW